MKKLLLLTFCLASLAGTAQLTAWKNAFPGYPALPKSSVQDSLSLGNYNLCYTDSDVLLFGYLTEGDSVQICLYDDKNLKLLKKIKSTHTQQTFVQTGVFYLNNEIYIFTENYLFKYVNDDWVNTGISIHFNGGSNYFFISKYRNEVYFFGQFDSIAGKQIWNAAKWDGVNFKQVSAFIPSGELVQDALVKHDTMFLLLEFGTALIVNGSSVKKAKHSINFASLGDIYETKDNIYLTSFQNGKSYKLIGDSFYLDTKMPTYINTQNYMLSEVIYNDVPIFAAQHYPKYWWYTDYFVSLDNKYAELPYMESIIKYKYHYYNSTNPKLAIYHNRLYVMDWIDTTNIFGDTLRYIACLSENLNKVTGSVYNDINKNCIKDTTVKAIKSLLVEIKPGHSVTSTDEKVNYEVYLPPGNYTLEIDSSKYWRTSQCNTFSRNIKIIDTIQTNIINNVDFALTKIGGIDDLSVNLVGNTGWRIRRGFNELYTLLVTNEGTSIQKPEIKLYLPNNLSITNPNINPTSVSGNIYTWNLDSIVSDSSVQIEFWIKMDTGKVHMGDTINFYASVNPVLSDTAMNDNYDTLTQKVFASFDPNSKQVWPTGSDSINIIEPGTKEVEYLINFENLGNDTAYNIYILDTISTSLDIHHIKLTGSSHSYIPSVLPCNPFHGKCIIKWSFNNINLPPKNTSKDYVLNRGHIGYKISLMAKLPIKTQINNTAYIYFDYNAAVVTNTSILVIDTIPQIIDTSGNIDTTNISIIFPQESNLKIYPNPTNDILNIKNNSNENKYITMCDMMGKMVFKTYITANETKQIDMKNYSNGLYMVWVEGRNQPVKVVKR